MLMADLEATLISLELKRDGSVRISQTFRINHAGLLFDNATLQAPATDLFKQTIANANLELQQSSLMTYGSNKSIMMVGTCTTKSPLNSLVKALTKSRER